MALFVKQDFTPPLLSRKWIAIKCRPNMLLQCRAHVINILESGLMYREDCAKVEQEAPGAEELWMQAGGGKSGWLTRGEKVLSVLSVVACVVAFPPKVTSFQRGTLIHVTSYAAVPLVIRIAHRFLAHGSTLKLLLDHMRDYLALARRSMACLKEYRVLHKGLGSVSSMLESTVTLLWRQQSELAVLMARSSSALLGNFPWLYEDVDWEALWKVSGEVDQPSEGDLVKIHHAFLVIQSTLLKHIAMAHFHQPLHTRKRYVNHNERLHWLHNHLLENLKIEFKEHHESLDRMYRLLRNFDTSNVSNVKRSAVKSNDVWLYSDVHSDVARCAIELKVALNKCTNLDMFLDTCSRNKQTLDLEILNKDIEDLIDDINRCVNTTENSRLRLQKLRSRFKNEKEAVKLDEEPQELEVEGREVIRIGDTEPEVKDEVFYFVKTEDDDCKEAIGDVTTVPGKPERDATRVVLRELKRKLVRREDQMRERERRALMNVMPGMELPEFPRQIQLEECLDKKGYISKICRVNSKKLFRNYKIKHYEKNFLAKNKFSLQRRTYNTRNSDYYVTYSRSQLFPKLMVTVESDCCRRFLIVKWLKCSTNEELELDSSGMSDGLSDVESNATNRNINQCLNTHKRDHVKKKENEATNFVFTRKDLDFNSSSESDFEDYQKENRSLLQDVRRHRVARRKNYPTKWGNANLDNGGDQDESLKPVEYSFGTGLSMASVLQANNKKLFSMAQEEVFIGDGEVSGDSGNDDV